MLCLTPAVLPKASSVEKHVYHVMTCLYCIFYYIVTFYSYACMMCFIMLRYFTRAG